MMNASSPYSFICAPITETHAGDFLASMREADQIADAIELRLDYLPAESLPQLIVELSSAIARVSKPLILTFRPREQGGNRDWFLQARGDFWRGLPPEIIDSITFADFESIWSKVFPKSRRPWRGRRSSVRGTTLRRRRMT